MSDKIKNQEEMENRVLGHILSDEEMTEVSGGEDPIELPPITTTPCTDGVTERQ